MTTTIQAPPTLGRCPECRTVIESFDVRIDESTDGPPAIVAECPTCHRPVNPE